VSPRMFSMNACGELAVDLSVLNPVGLCVYEML